MSSRIRWPPRSPRYRSATHSTPPRKWGRCRWSANATEWSTTIAKGIEEGATLVTGGGRLKHLKRGYYIESTVFAGVGTKHVIAQEEIFGPVLSVIPADNDQHAVDIANDTIYALNAAVFTPDVGRARSPDDCARAPLGTTECGSISTSRSVGSSSLAWAGRVAGKDSCLNWRARRCCWTGRRPSRN